MKNSYENKVLLSEAKKTLDDQVESLDFSIQSKLTQARYHAIDKGLLSSSVGEHRHYVLKGLSVACICLLSLVFAMNSDPIYSIKKMFSEDSQLPVAGLPLIPKEIPKELPKEEDKTAKSSRDTKEEIEIYNWLYEQFG